MIVEIESMKRAAAESAVKLVRDGDVVGLGTGSTARYAIAALGVRVRQGMRLVGVATSEESARLARAEGIVLADLANQPTIDITIDGADEIDPQLNLVKGGGGALVREKIVAMASRRLVVVADATKIVEQLGTRMALPVAVVPFAWPVVEAAVTRLGGTPRLRRLSGPDPIDDPEPMQTDDGLYVIDCAFSPLDSPATLERDLRAIVGIVATGLFLDLAERAFVGMPDGSVREHLGKQRGGP